MTIANQVGFYEQDITPLDKVFLAGFASRTEPMTGVQDPLYLRIMTLTDKKNNTAIIITADLLSFPEDFSWRIKGWSEQQLGIPSANIILNVSHTHYGPILEQHKYNLNWTVDGNYLNNLEVSIKNGIIDALNMATECEIYYGFTNIKLGINRRLTVENQCGNCIVEMRPNKNGLYDSQIPVITFYKQNKLLGIFYSVNCHPTSQAINMVSADYPGAVSRGLKKLFAENIYTIFAQGTGASAKTAFYDKDSLTFSPATLEELDILGMNVAEKIHFLINSKNMHRLELTISGAEKEFTLPYDRNKFLDQSQLLKLTSLTDGFVPSIETQWAAQVYETNRLNRTLAGYNMHITKLALNNDLTIIGMSGEVTGEMGALVKQLFLAKSIICLGYCTKTDAYIPTAAMLTEGGYEADNVCKYFGWPAPFSPKIDQIIQQEIVF